ncbi:MAG: ribonucleotide-diphosphate reductase subunit alpha [Thermoplasmata archaeon]|nr:MAG: ribonucleotide-diphosphate reductase subunit alpha [Thermoplasmata archaeon]
MKTHEPPEDLPEPELTENAMIVLKRRYLQKDPSGEVVETPKQLFWRVAKVIAEADKAYDENADVVALAREFYTMMVSKDFIPNSPTLMNAGTPLGQLSACFVLPIEDSMEGIFETLKNTAKIHQSGGGTGFSFSRIRPKGDLVRSTMGVASGPVSFIKVYDAATEAVKQGGRRRGANMGILRVDHPDILEFITCKDKEGEIKNFNLSVAITDEFMEAYKKDGEYPLVNPRTGEVVKRLRAREVFDLIAKMAHKNGEPGVVFIDTINKHNPTPHVGEIESTNPCGEQPLLPYESCNLGSINVSNFVKEGKIDYARLKEIVWKAVHFLDNVIDVNHFPLKEIGENTKALRKVGLGIMGWADLLVKMRIPYDSEEAVKLAEELMGFIDREAKEASRKLAEIRGPFPRFEGSVYDRRGEPPIRNATVTTIAPTGTISIIAGCSSGIEPIFALAFERHVLDRDRLLEIHPLFREALEERGIYSKELIKRVLEEGSIRNFSDVPEDLRRIFVTALDIAPEWHVMMQAAFQQHVDNAVSKTINFPNNATVDDIKKSYLMAYELGCKGLTVYRDGSREEQVLNRLKRLRERKKEGRYIKPRPRPAVMQGVTGKIKVGCGNLYITINYDDEGPFEVFSSLGKAGGCAAAQIEAISRLVSLGLRSGIDPFQIVRQLKGIRCPIPIKIGPGQGEILSCPDAIGRALERFMLGKPISFQEEVLGHTLDRFTKEENSSEESERGTSEMSEPETAGHSSREEEIFHVGVCPECGSPLKYKEGCDYCPVCFYTKCE